VTVQSREDCIGKYRERLLKNHVRFPEASVLLTAYLAWPNNEERRNSFIATQLARSGHSSDEEAKNLPTNLQAGVSLEMFGGVNAIATAAFDQLVDEIDQVQRKWLQTADIFQLTVDMAYDESVELRRGSSISKAIDLCELEHGLPGHSQLRRAWSEFRDVAHLLTAGAYLAHEGLPHANSADKVSILNAIWSAPDSVLALGYGLQEFGLQPKPIRTESSILRPEALWHIPDRYRPETPFVVYRRLTEAQIEFLNSRRVA
jgi:hypothetical protein